MRQLLLGFVLATQMGGVVLSNDEALPDIRIFSTSPDKQITIQYRRLGIDKTGGSKIRVELIGNRNGKVLYSWESCERHLDATWTQDGRRVAVNDCNANSGDVVYVFTIEKGNIRLLRRPYDKIEQSDLHKRHPQLPLDVGKFTLYATGWKNSIDLECDAYGYCWDWPKGLSRPKKTVYFRYKWTVRFDGNSSGQVVEEKVDFED